MQGLALQTSNSIVSIYGKTKLSFFNVLDYLSSKPSIPTRSNLPCPSANSSLLRCTGLPKLHPRHSRIIPYASNVGVGSGSFEESQGNVSVDQPSTDGSSKMLLRQSGVYPVRTRESSGCGFLRQQI